MNLIARLSRRPLLVAVEGNIGAGKSTLVERLAQLQAHRPASRVFGEPVSANPYLADFYRDPAQFALRTQLWLLAERFRTYQQALEHCAACAERNEGGLVLLDRSMWSDAVFARQARCDETLSESEFSHYERVREQLWRRVPLQHAVLALDVSVDECLHRILNVRKRAIEKNMPRAYLAGLASQYKEHYSEMESAGVPVVHIDWEKYGDAEQVLEKLLTLEKEE